MNSFEKNYRDKKEWGRNGVWEWGLACVIDLLATQPGSVSLARRHVHHTFPRLTAFRGFGARGLRGTLNDKSGALFKVQGSTKENSAGRLHVLMILKTSK